MAWKEHRTLNSAMLHAQELERRGYEPTDIEVLKVFRRPAKERHG